jgi:hypothetical protein
VYKVASEKAQRKAERITMRDATGGDKLLPDGERLEMLREELRKVDAAIVATHPNSEERKTLGKRKRILADEVAALKEAVKKRPGLGPIFYDVARRLLPRETYEQVEAEARHVYDLRHGRKP